MGALSTMRAGAQEGSLFPFKDDRGSRSIITVSPRTFRPRACPASYRWGAKTPDVILVEFFDYNCPYCRVAAKDLAGILDQDRALRLDLVNNPILSVGSVQAAKVQQAILRGYGPEKAYAFHRRAFASPGPMDGPSALKVAADLGLDAKRIETEGDLPQIGDVIKRQAGLAQALGFAATPSFILGSTGLLGYPGAESIKQAVAATEKCDKLVCPAE